jgi:hypothetical protein
MRYCVCILAWGLLFAGYLRAGGFEDLGFEDLKIKAESSNAEGSNIQIFKCRRLKYSNKEYVFGLIDSMNFEHPEIVRAIAVLESGNFTSPLFRSQNNIFGMRRVKGRRTTQLDTDTKYGVYGSLKSCVEDMKIFWNLYYAGLTEGEVYGKLGRNYAADPDYAEKIRRIINNLGERGNG